MAHRSFRDPSGREWEVWDVRPLMAERRMADAHQTVVPERRRHQQPRAPLPGELRDGWLAFESQTERRRFTPPPPDWSEMSDDELAALLDQSVPAGKARRLIE